MIKFAENQDIYGVIELMGEAFSDTPKMTEEFFKRYKDTLLLYKEGDKVLGMLSALKVTFKEKSGRYIYAVATKKEAQNRGISTSLLEFIKDYTLKHNEDFLVLVPSEKSLFEFYKKRGFESLACAKKERVYGKKDCIKIEKIKAEELHSLRKEFIGENLIEWGENELLYAEFIYGNILKITNNSGVGYALLAKAENELLIKELSLKGIDVKTALMGLNFYFDTDVATAIIPKENTEPFAMIYPDEYKNAIFGIALD